MSTLQHKSRLELVLKPVSPGLYTAVVLSRAWTWGARALQGWRVRVKPGPKVRALLLCTVDAAPFDLGPGSQSEVSHNSTGQLPYSSHGHSSGQCGPVLF